MKKVLIILFLIPICVSAQRFEEQINFYSVGDQEMSLGRYRIGSLIRIECQIGGGWAEDGGIYHIAADWGHLPKVIYRGESSISQRLKFYGYVDPNSNGYAYLFATWENQSPNKTYANDVKFTIQSEGNFDVNNKGSYANSTELENVLVVQSNTGRIGIGTNSPISKLDVNGQITVSAPSGILFYSSNKGVQTFKLTNDNLIGVNNIIINDDGVSEGIDWQNGRNISMSTVGQGGYNAFRFGTKTSFPYVFEGGNVGIGTTNPKEKLVVNGKISATEVKVKSTPNSDYIFEPDYALRPIQEVETFIKAYKHLPDIPSAEEFKQNGVGLGEMDNMLLKKVEELTLYVIELKKENEELKARDKEIDELKAMVKVLMNEK